ncbi:M56 family metallopeptidase [Flavobacteriaceae bacterium LMO-SS05]
MLHYILQILIFQAFFLLVYDAFLKKETFFNWNRLYLLSTAALTVILPFIKIDSFKDVVSQQYIIRLPEVLIGNKGQLNTSQVSFETIGLNSQSSWSWDLILYTGMFIAVLLLGFKVIKIVRLLSQNPKERMGRFRIIKLIDSTVAFSFFNYIFLGSNLSGKEIESILKHEMVHVRHWHSLDLLFFEFMRIIFWFNPLVYMYQNRMMTIHEFVADSSALKHQDKTTYYQNLLSQVFETKNISFINPFFKQSLIKKRIVMLSKSKSKQINLLKYTILCPLVLGMLVYTSCVQNAYGQQEDTKWEIKKVSNSPLIKKIQAVKSQIQIQGHTNEDEDYGLNLLLSLVKSNVLNTTLLKEIQDYGSLKNKTPLMERINDLFDQIQIQGEVTEDEEKSLKNLLILTSDNGFKDPIFADVLQDVEVPFSVIDEVPIYPGCESFLTNEERKQCMSDKIAQHVNANFNTKLGKELGLTGRQRVNVVFKIDNHGNIVDVRSRASHPALEEEAIRVIKTFPKMIPGKQKGIAVNVPYSLPIIFEVMDDNNNPEKPKN